MPCATQASTATSSTAAHCGAHIITAYELHDAGMDAILERIPDGGQYYLP